VYTVEMARPKIEMARESFQEAQLDSYITQIEGTIDQALDNWDRPIDFMFIDADKMNYLSYFKKVEPHLVPNAIVVADNASNFAEYMTDYLEHVTKNESYASYLINIEHGLMVTIKL
jgi:predicted O-methyltransferase YrrM